MYTTKNKSSIVFIGRFQPPTIAHYEMISEALKKAEQVIICIGSYKATKTLKNPWSYEERENMIYSMFKKDQKIICIPLRDYMYNDTTWISSLQNKVSDIVGHSNKNVSIIGCFKDDSSYYLKFFPQWKLMDKPIIQYDGKPISATTVRDSLFSKLNDSLPSGLHNLIESKVAWNLDSYLATTEYENLHKEYEYIKSYKKQWENSPYPPIFVTTDAVVVQSGHVLVIKRKTHPGKDLWALPGGFIKDTEYIKKSMLRELKEETRIELPKVILEKSIKDVHVFDHPKRSLRGRTITHAHLIVLDNTKPLPVVRGDDDAKDAKWMSFNDLILNESNFFEDHLFIIQYFINKL